MIGAAARAGVGEAAALWRMSAAELEWAIEAHRARQARELEMIDLLAWLMGSYMAVGVHAPKKYPKRPNALRGKKMMTDEEMKRAALGFAARHTGGDGHGHHA